MVKQAEDDNKPPMQGFPQPDFTEVNNLPNIHISAHPVVAHKLTQLRDKHTPPSEFSRLVKELGVLLAYEAMADLALVPRPIETPLKSMLGQRLAGGVGVVPILRAGLGLSEGFREVFPEVQIWHLGVRRNKQTLEPIE